MTSSGDYKLIVEGVEIPCTKKVVDQSSVFVDMLMFTEDDSSVVIPVPQLVSLDTMLNIVYLVDSGLDFGKLELKQFFQIFSSVDFLGFTDLKMKMERFIQKTAGIITMANIVKIYDMAEMSSTKEHLVDFLSYHVKNCIPAEMNYSFLTPEMLKRLLGQRKIDISKDNLMDILLNWAIENKINGFNSSTTELFLAMPYKVVKSCAKLSDLVKDLGQLDILPEPALETVLNEINSAIEFKNINWDLSFSQGQSVPSKEVNKNLKLSRLNQEKVQLDWPKCILTLPEMLNKKSDEKTILQAMYKSPEKLSFRSSIFYRSHQRTGTYSKVEKTVLVQFNWDMRACFVVLELPSTHGGNGQPTSRMVRVHNHLYHMLGPPCTPCRKGRSVEVHRLDLDAAVVNSPHAKWENFTEIPEEFVPGSGMRREGEFQVGSAGNFIFVFSDQIFVRMDVSTKEWEEVELEAPNRSSPMLIGTETELIVFGGKCGSTRLTSGQIYKLSDWSMQEIAAIPINMLPIDKSFLNYSGFVNKNILHLFPQDQPDVCEDVMMMEDQGLKYDIFSKEWSRIQRNTTGYLFCVDEPVWKMSS